MSDEDLQQYIKEYTGFDDNQVCLCFPKEVKHEITFLGSNTKTMMNIIDEIQNNLSSTINNIVPIFILFLALS